MRRKLIYFIFWVGAIMVKAQTQKTESYLAGVYKGETLFIQNPFIKDEMSFCVENVFVNDVLQKINANLSAIKIDFEGLDLNTPVKVRIVHRDTTCKPIIINPDAILFHTIFRFNAIYLTDTALIWSTKGERGIGAFSVEKLTGGIWAEESTIEASGNYSGEKYHYYPSLEEGPNKYRVKYHFPEGSRIEHLYSWEVEYDFYPEPVEFSPKSVKKILKFSRYTPFEIYDMKTNLIYSGEGKEVDLSKIRMRRGQYTIYFDGRYPGTFFRE